MSQSPPITEAESIPYSPGSGADLVLAPGDTTSGVRLWVHGDDWPRIKLDVINGQFLIGDGTVAPTAPTQLNNPTFANGVRVRGPYPIAFGDANLIAAGGHSLFTPGVGDLLLDAFVIVHTKFVSTIDPAEKPGLHLGSYAHLSEPFPTNGGATVPTFLVGDTTFDGAQVESGGDWSRNDAAGSKANLSAFGALAGATGASVHRVPTVVLAATPLRAKIDNVADPTAPVPISGLAAGSADIYVLTATPAP